MKLTAPTLVKSTALAALLAAGCTAATESPPPELAPLQSTLTEVQNSRDEAKANHGQVAASYYSYNKSFETVLDPRKSGIEGQVSAKTAERTLQEQNYLLSVIQMSSRGFWGDNAQAPTDIDNSFEESNPNEQPTEETNEEVDQQDQQEPNPSTEDPSAPSNEEGASDEEISSNHFVDGFGFKVNGRSQSSFHLSGSNHEVRALSSASLLLTFTSETPDVCRVTEGSFDGYFTQGRISLRATGDCTITASHPGNNEYASTSLTKTIPVTH